jgi:methylmalonyl-CoA/ethylmalonyl-CoA epimerase
MIDRLHHIGIVVHDADAALGFYRDIMGLEVAVDEVVEEQGVRGVLLPLGENEIELLQPVQPDTGVARYLETRGQTLHHFCFSTDDIRAELARVRDLGVELIDEEPRYGLAGEIAFLHPRSMHGVLVELAQPPPDAQHSDAKGFDHLAARVADYEAASKRWNEVVGAVERRRLQVDAMGWVLGQFPIGQCVLELIAPARPDAPLAKTIEEEGERAFPVAAIEVADLDTEIARYRAAGLEVPDGEPGVLPGTRRSTISAEQAFGIGIQLLEYV